MNTVSMTITGGHTRYAPFVQRWWNSVLAMDTRPDEIIAVIDEQDSTGVSSIIDTQEIPAQIIRMDEPYSMNYVNAAFDAATCEWMSFCGLDDKMMPHAYADISAAGDADIIVGSIELSSGGIWHGNWDVDALSRSNTLPAHSLFRKGLWTELGGIPDIRWSDWGFWLKCAQFGVTTYKSQHVTAWFDLGADHETMSGFQVSSDVRAAADRELLEFRQTMMG
jgi:hypothetical protein